MEVGGVGKRKMFYSTFFVPFKFWPMWLNDLSPINEIFNPSEPFGKLCRIFKINPLLTDRKCSFCYCDLPPQNEEWGQLNPTNYTLTRPLWLKAKQKHNQVQKNLFMPDTEALDIFLSTKFGSSTKVYFPIFKLTCGVLIILFERHNSHF